MTEEDLVLVCGLIPSVQWQTKNMRIERLEASFRWSLLVGFRFSHENLPRYLLVVQGQDPLHVVAYVFLDVVCHKIPPRKTSQALKFLRGLPEVQVVASEISSWIVHYTRNPTFSSEVQALLAQ